MSLLHLLQKSATHWFSGAQRHLMLPRDTADQISAAGTFCTLYSPYVAYVVPIYVVALLFGNSWFLSPSRSICFTVHELRGELIRMNLWIRPSLDFLQLQKDSKTVWAMLNCKFSKALTTRNRANRHRRQRKNLCETQFGHLPDWSFIHFYM